MNISKMCRDIENLSSFERKAQISLVMADLKEGLTEFFGNEENANTTIFQLLLASIAADGKLTVDEFVFIKPLFDSVSGGECTFDEAKAIFKDLANDPEKLKNDTDVIVDAIGLIKSELKTKLVLLCLLICGIDGKVSTSEQLWIEQLIR